MKTSEMVLLGIAGYIGYQYISKNNIQLTPQNGGTSIGLPAINLDLSGLLTGSGGGATTPSGGLNVSDLTDILTGIASRGSGVTDTGNGFNTSDIIAAITGAIPAATATTGGSGIVSELTNRISELEKSLMTVKDSGVSGFGQDAVTKWIEDALTKQLDKLKIPAPSDVITNQAKQAATGIREKVGQYGGIAAGAGVTYATKGILPFATRWSEGILERLLPKVAGTLAGHAAADVVPILGWLYMGADIGATAYELISGHNIAGSWLGWGELIQGDKAKAEEQTYFNIDKANADSADRNLKITNKDNYDFLTKVLQITPEYFQKQLAGNNLSPMMAQAQRDTQAKGGTREQPVFSESNYPKPVETFRNVGGTVIGSQGSRYTPEQAANIDWRY